MSEQPSDTGEQAPGVEAPEPAGEPPQLPEMAQPLVSAATPPDPELLAGLPDNTPMVQLYRGELSRLVNYRVRLDTTTNWALGASMAVVSFALGQPEVPHAVLLLPYLLSVVFLSVESRRYQEFALSQRRVRLLETGFFSAHLGGAPAGGWQGALVESLRNPQLPVSFFAAVCMRTRRNYLWVFLTIYGAWLLKLWLAHEPLLEAARVGTLAGGPVLAVGTALTLLWVLCAALPSRVDPVRS